LPVGELLSAVTERLLKAMHAARPGGVRQLLALANQHMRWELNDLARRLDEQPATAALRGTDVAAPPGSSDACLAPLGRRLMGAIEGLPEAEREAFDLVRIQGLTHAEAAGLVGVTEKAVKKLHVPDVVRGRRYRGRERPH
jgi:RNA polymerase sigma-70 factor (ECF subfamily)